MNARVPITEAAIRLSMTYHQVRNQLLRGELKGGRDEFGRFYVDFEDIKRKQRQQRSRARALRPRPAG